MGRQRFGICLPFSILILTEVILMSCDGEAASLSDAQRWQKNRRAETTNFESSSTEYDSEKYPNLDKKISKKGNKAKSNWKKTDRGGNGKLKMKDTDLTEQNNIAYDQTALKNKRGSWQCNGVHIPGDQINVVYSDGNNSPLSQNPTSNGQAKNYYYSRTIQQKAVIDKLKNTFEPVFNFIRSAAVKSGLNNDEGNQYPKSDDREQSSDTHSNVYQWIRIIRDLLNSIIEKKGISYSKDKSAESGNDVRRSDVKETGSFFRYLKSLINTMLYNNSNTDKRNGISYKIEDIPPIFQSIASISNSFQQAVRSQEPVQSNGDSIDPHGSYSNQFTQPMHDVIKPVETVVDSSNSFKSDTVNETESSKLSLDLLKPIKSIANLLNPFKRMINQQETYQSINNDSLKARQLLSDLFNSLSKLEINERKFTQRDNNLLLKPFQTIIEILEPFKLSSNRQGMFRGIHNDQTKPSRPISDGVNSFESNTNHQDVPQFQFDDLILIIINLINSFMEIGDNPKPSQRMDSGIDNENQTYTPLESFIINFDPYRFFGNESDYSQVITNILKYFKSLNDDGKTQSETIADSNSQSDDSLTLNRSRRSIRDTKYCPIIPSDYHQATGSRNAYKIYKNYTNWNDARLNCKNEAAQLALPENEAEYDAMIEYIKGAINSGDKNLHIGFHSLFSTEKWTTVCGESLPFEHWINGTMSDDVTDKKCGGLVISPTNETGFISQSCNHLLPFICEIIIPSDCA